MSRLSLNTFDVCLSRGALCEFLFPIDHYIIWDDLNIIKDVLFTSLEKSKDHLLGLWIVKHYKRYLIGHVQDIKLSLDHVNFPSKTEWMNIVQGMVGDGQVGILTRFLFLMVFPYLEGIEQKQVFVVVNLDNNSIFDWIDILNLKMHGYYEFWTTSWVYS